MLPRRLGRLPERQGPGDARLFLACSTRARLLGLACLADVPMDCALLIPRCSSVHTFGMRFAIDVVFLDREWRILRVECGVRPRRLLRCRGAGAVLELRS